MEENNKIQYISWKVPEFDKKEREKTWYIVAVIFMFITLFFCFFEISSWKIVFLGVNSNFMFALILILSAMIMIINDGQDPNLVEFKLGPEGINIGQKFHDYDDLKHFSIIFKPEMEVKNLYFEFNNSFLNPRLSIPLFEQDPIAVRSYLKRYLDEDLERLGPPISEQLTKMLKL